MNTVMPPENPTAENTATAVADLPTVAAPPREKRLVPVTPRPRRTPAATVPVPKQRAAGRPTPQIPAIERKVAALEDPDEILNVIRTEAVLRRAQRLSGQGDAQRQTIRVLSVCMLFALLAAAVGAMWYLQTSLQGSHRPRRPATAPMQAEQRAPAVR